jgi:hypothetical protein
MRSFRLQVGAPVALAAVLLLWWVPPGRGQSVPTPPEKRLLFLGDAGSGTPEQHRVRDQMRRFPAPLAFLLGDNIYSRGERERFGPYFDEVYRPLLENGTSFHAALGNHDVHFCDVDIRDPLPADGTAYHWGLVPCDVRYQLTHPSFGYLGGRRYYSVTSDGSATPLGEVFVLDSNTLRSSQSKLSTLREDKAQLEWLRSALARSRARWKIVIFHHPTHTPSVGAKTFLFIPWGEGRAREVRLDRQLAPLLKQGGVDVVLAGHNHFYARMRPQDGIRYFVSGGGGRSIYEFKGDSEYVAAGGAFFHFVHVRLTPERFEYYVIDEAGRSRDAGWWMKGDAQDRPFPRGTLPPAPP